MASITPKLSVLIPTFNREKYIEQALNSVIDQGFKDLEIICFDNASTDRTFYILKKYAKRYKFIRVFQNKTNLGPVSNWKKCLDQANGEFVHWLWSDDWIEPNFYLDGFSLIDEYNLCIVSTWNYRYDENNKAQKKYISWQYSNKIIPGKEGAKKILFSENELPVSPAAYIIKNELVKKYFYMNIPKISEKLDPVTKAVGVDSLMIIGACMESKYIATIQKPSVVFRKHQNISTQLAKDRSLSKMYFIAHIWFFSKSDLKISLQDLIIFSLKIINCFRLTLFNIHILKLLTKFYLSSIFKLNKLFTTTIYNSKKAAFVE